MTKIVYVCNIISNIKPLLTNLNKIMDKTKISITCIIGVAIIICSALLCKGLTNFKKDDASINVTGMAEKEIVSDLIVWDVTLNAEGKSRAEAYREYEKTKKIFLSFLKNNGLKKENITEEGASLNKKTKSFYDSDRGRYVSIDDGFEVSQSIKISSSDLPLVEEVYQSVSNLYAEGIDFSSSAPCYYYTHLNDLKKDLLHDASKNAYERAKTIAEGCNCSVGKLTNSNMGVFQIVGLNSDEDYSWGGTFNTSSKVKVASITVKAKYEAD